MTEVAMLLAGGASAGKLVARLPSHLKAAGGAVLKGTAKGGTVTATEVIQFGRVPNKVSHAFRHTDAIGLQREAVQSAVKNHLKLFASNIGEGNPFIQTIEVGGQKIQYTAYRLSDGTINVGRIHPVNP